MSSQIVLLFRNSVFTCNELWRKYSDGKSLDLNRSKVLSQFTFQKLTMGGTKSHKIPFWELANELINRWVDPPKEVSSPYSNRKLTSGHTVTFLSGFPADFHVAGLEEIAPTNLVDFIQNYSRIDFLGELHITYKNSFAAFVSSQAGVCETSRRSLSKTSLATLLRFVTCWSRIQLESF